jgi:hypothetical protein
LFLEILLAGDINDTEFDTFLGTGKHLTMVVGSNGCELLFAEDGFVVEDAIQLEGKFERRDVDVEFDIDCISAVEMEFERWIELG